MWGIYDRPTCGANSELTPTMRSHANYDIQGFFTALLSGGGALPSTPSNSSRGRNIHKPIGPGRGSTLAPADLTTDHPLPLSVKNQKELPPTPPPTPAIDSEFLHGACASMTPGGPSLLSALQGSERDGTYQESSLDGEAMCMLKI